MAGAELDRLGHLSGCGKGTYLPVVELVNLVRGEHALGGLPFSREGDVAERLAEQAGEANVGVFGEGVPGEGQLFVVMVDICPVEVRNPLAGIEEVPLIRSGVGPVQEIAGFVGVGGVGQGAGAGEEDNGVEGVTAGFAQVLSLVVQLYQPSDQQRDDNERGGCRPRVDNSVEVSGQVAL